MRTRNAGTPKTTPASQKKTPPSTRKSTAKTTPAPPPTVAEEEQSTPVSTTPTSAATASASEPDATPAPQPDGEQMMVSAEDAIVAPPTKGAAAPKKKVTKSKKVIKKVLRPKASASAKAGSAAAVKVGETEDVKGDQDQKDDVTADANNEQSLKAEDVAMKTTESEDQKEIVSQRAEDLGDPQDKGKSKMDIDDSSNADDEIDAKPESPIAEGALKVSEDPCVTVEGQVEVKCNDPNEEINDFGKTLDSEDAPQDQPENVDDDEKPENMINEQNPENKDAVDHIEEPEDEAAELIEDAAAETEGIEDYGDEEGFVEPGEEDLREEDEPESTDDMKALDEEHKELAAAAKERKIKKELEIYVGGLDHEVVEEDVKKAFEKAGEVVEVRLLKDPTTNKNRGIAFVRFATKDQARKALSEMKNPLIRGKRCGTAANEDNDTLFVGNICNTWTKEAIKQKLKDYNLEGIESITLVQDPRHEGLSRGFCFIQFDCHADAMSAYKRLQKPDVVFGHAERTTKVAFAEPLQEPDPEVMAKVKSVFLDGLPPFWDEDHVRKHFKDYGEIERVTLARNMSTAKRKDFGFVDYMTHEAAIACIEDVNKKELVDGNVKTKVRARLSNPLPKLQAVKGGMSGGFRIGRPTGRSVGRPGPSVNRPNFQYGRGSRGPFNNTVRPYGQRVPFRDVHGAPAFNASGRSSYAGPRHGLIERGPARPFPPRRQPFLLDDVGYSRSFVGRPYDDPYMYDDGHGLKRPFYMTEQDPGYMEPSRVRPRIDYSGSGRASQFRDAFGAASSVYSSGYYGTDFGAPPPSFNGPDLSYGRGSGRGSEPGYSSSGRGSGSGSGYSGSGSGYSGSGSGYSGSARGGGHSASGRGSGYSGSGRGGGFRGSGGGSGRGSGFSGSGRGGGYSGSGRGSGSGYGYYY